MLELNQPNAGIFLWAAIEEANWLTLPDDLLDADLVPDGGFDAVICLGNSFAHLPDFEGNQSKQKDAIKNFKDVLRPGELWPLYYVNIIIGNSCSGIIYPSFKYFK